jgi:hypothetical protein
MKTWRIAAEGIRSKIRIKREDNNPANPFSLFYEMVVDLICCLVVHISGMTETDWEGQLHI